MQSVDFVELEKKKTEKKEADNNLIVNLLNLFSEVSTWPSLLNMSLLKLEI